MQQFAATFKDCGAWDPRYWGFFKTFNEGRFYEAHDVLEDLWLECRQTRLDTFYKAMIQLAGAFVHIGKSKPRPAVALLDLSQGYLKPFGDDCEGLQLGPIHAMIDQWRRKIAANMDTLSHIWPPETMPQLQMPQSP